MDRIQFLDGKFRFFHLISLHNNNLKIIIIFHHFSIKSTQVYRMVVVAKVYPAPVHVYKISVQFRSSNVTVAKDIVISMKHKTVSGW